MSRALQIAAAVAALVLLTGAKGAQPPIDDPEAKITRDIGVTVEALVVGAGPTWWTVRKGQKTVRILAAPFNLPKDVSWSRRRLDVYLADAGGLILPPGYDPRVLDRIEPNRELGVLPVDLQRRLAAVSEKLGTEPTRYASLDPLVAGYRLTTDFRQSLGVQSETVVQAAAAEAERLGVPIYVPPVPVNTVPSLRISREAGAACVEGALAEVEAGAALTRQAAEAWSVGDVNKALTAPRGLERCGFAMPGLADYRRAQMRAQMVAIRQSLNGVLASRFGRREMVAIVNLRTFLAEGGVLDQLRAQGLEVTGGRE